MILGFSQLHFRIHILSCESQEFADRRVLPQSCGGNMTTQTYSQSYKPLSLP
jgi:hypothetical protein